MEFTKSHRGQLEWKQNEIGCGGGYLWFSAAEKTAEGRGPDGTGCLNILQTSDDLESEANEDHHGEHDEEVLQERDEGEGGWREEDREGDEEMEYRDQLEQKDVKSEGMVWPGSVVESIEAEDGYEDREDSVDHQDGRSEYLS